MFRMGFLVNPVAGIGGKVALKGSDGRSTWSRALSLGAIPESELKALTTIEALREIMEELEIITCPGRMGEEVCRTAGVSFELIPEPQHPLAVEPVSTESEEAGTTPADTVRYARAMAEVGVDLLVFAGGDGTARDILDAVGEQCLVLGIPTGCKIHSAVYARSPRHAAALIRRLVEGKLPHTREAEVMDIDEDLFRRDIVDARLYGYLRIPGDDRFVQRRKSGSVHTEAAELSAIALEIIDRMKEDTLYIISTGTTTAAIMKELGLPNTLLGVDLVYNRKLLASDCTEEEILRYLSIYPEARIVTTIIGGQGYIFGRGNHQISAAVIRRVGRENLLIAATHEKLLSLPDRTLYVDTGDEEVNGLFSGYVRVIVGCGQTAMVRIQR